MVRPRNYPETFDGFPIVYIGFWRSSSEPELPIPVASLYDNAAIVSRLYHLQSECNKWQSNYAKRESFRGISVCRICNHGNGGEEFTYKSDGKIYVWPSGLIHYLEKHNIEPPQELRDLTEFQELKWNLKRQNPKMEVFPFNVRANEDSIVEIWNEHRPKGISWSNVSAQVRSNTEIRLVVRASGEDDPVFDQVLTLPEEELNAIVYARKYQMAGEEYDERRHIRREHDIKAIMKEMFGE